jgi:hypothetical protein
MAGLGYLFKVGPAQWTDSVPAQQIGQVQLQKYHKFLVYYLFNYSDEHAVVFCYPDECKLQ